MDSLCEITSTCRKCSVCGKVYTPKSSDFLKVCDECGPWIAFIFAMSYFFDYKKKQHPELFADDKPLDAETIRKLFEEEAQC